jgi:hypothetical protein
MKTEMKQQGGDATKMAAIAEDGGDGEESKVGI